jgi:dihydroneopterin aldolase
VIEIVIDGLRFDTHIGILPSEKESPQSIVIHAILGLQMDHLGEALQMEDTVDYAIVVDRLKEVALQKHFDLIEHLLDACMWMLFSEFYRIETLTLSVHKPQAIGGGVSVGIRTTMTRSEWENAK